MQTIFPSSPFRNEFPTLQTANAFINRVSPTNWAIVVDLAGSYIVTSEGHAARLIEQGGYQLVNSLAQLKSTFRTWLRQLKAEIMRVDKRCTASMLRDRMFTARAWANFADGLSVEQAASPFARFAA